MSASLIFFLNRVFGRNIRINRRDQIKNQRRISQSYRHRSVNKGPVPVSSAMVRPETDSRVEPEEPCCRRSAVPVSVMLSRVGFAVPVPRFAPPVPVALSASQDQVRVVGVELSVPKKCRPLCPRHHYKIISVRAELPQDPFLLKVKDFGPFESQKIIGMDSDLKANKL